MDREKITAAIKALQGDDRFAIVVACGELDDAERECVRIILELTAPPVKKRRADAGVPRKKAAGS